MDDSKKSNRKNILILAGVLIAALGLLVFMAFAFFGLGGKLKYMSYTKISCTEDLQKLKEDPDGKFLLTSDIDMNGMEWKPFSFNGILDGHGYTIFGLTVTSTGEARRDTYDGNMKSYSTALAGMFDSLDQAQVRDLTFRDSHVDITSDEPCFVGTLAGYMSDSKITNVNVIGDVYLRAHDRMFGVGGVVGYGYGSFTGVQTDVTLVCIDTDRITKDEQFMGGICGAGYPDIVNCTIDIDGYVSEHGYTHNGGMIGLYMFSPEGMTYKGKMTGNSVYGKITFFEENDDRRAYCKGMIGEYLDELEVFENNGESFRAIEVKNYDADLLPEKELQSFEVEADKAGEYDVSISYSNPGEDATYGLFINDRFIKKAFFPMGEGTITETVHLDAGKAQVVFKYIPGDGNITVSSVFAVKSEKKVTLIVAPHEDDEILAFAGTIQKTIAEGNIVKVLFLTNGDYFGSDLTPVRYEESVRALELLGVDKSDITFLGYGDLTLGTILQSDNWDGMFRAHSGYYQTYGVPEQNLFDYRFLRSGSYAYYNRRD
ncbi:MAG: PIG-L family deacetylase, partial [Saccharofermentanaceae bacterium]|nr:PIG-L family deacetylase [Saccharofermentanaceae bacterium]